MRHQFSRMTDTQLVDELLMYCPPSGREVLREDFASSIHRYRRVLDSIPDGENGKSLLDVGARLYTASLYCNYLHYGKVSLGTKWKSSYTGDDILGAIPNSGCIDIRYFDAEKDIFPYADNAYDVVICSEIIEHLAIDPMHMMSEINRVTRSDGLLIVTTPNAASFDAIRRLLAGQHPYSWSPYNGTSTDRHNREYTVSELEKLLEASGFALVRAETFSKHPFSRKDRVLAKWISFPDAVRGRAGLDFDRLGQTSLVIGQKTSGVRERFPVWLYYDALKGR
jgi:SAM-dependent methyltransferase